MHGNPNWRKRSGKTNSRLLKHADLGNTWKVSRLTSPRLIGYSERLHTVWQTKANRRRWHRTAEEQIITRVNMVGFGGVGKL